MKNEMEEFNMLYENKKELLQLVLNNKSAERIPIGFWWHFAHGDDLIFGYKSVKTIRSIIEAHKKMYDVFSPDFMKIMSDGFFAHPSLIENNVTSISDISKVKPIHKNHPWIREQVAMVAELSNYVGKNIMLFYNIFSPLQSIRLNVKYLGGDAEAFQDMAVKYPEKLIKICEIIASDYALLAEELKNNTSIDGIYYSVQNLQHKKVDKLFHENYVMPIELNLLNQLNSFWEYNLLHICGYDHFKNKLDYYTKYKAKAYNWAVHTDKVSLKEELPKYGFNPDFKYQGSVPCNTHIKYHSDIDLLVIIDKFEIFENSARIRNRYMGDPKEDLTNLRAVCIEILKKSYSVADIEKNSKSIKISGGSLRRHIDVVPANWYNSEKWYDTEIDYYRGIQIFDNKTKERHKNFPFLNIHFD